MCRVERNAGGGTVLTVEIPLERLT